MMMAVHTRVKRTVVHHEWVMDAPAHHTDVWKAYTDAERTRTALQEDSNPPYRLGDIYLTGRDEELVISFTEEVRSGP